MSYLGILTIDGDEHLVGSTLYGTCSTPADVAAKEVICPNFAEIVTGVTIHVKFTNSNTASSPTLNVNSLGADAIYKYGTTAPGITPDTSWQAGSVVSFTFDGSYWQMNDHIDNTNTQTVTGVKGDSELSYRTGDVNITAANIGAAPSSHTHGNVQNDGTLQTNDVAISNGDKLVVTDSSDNDKVARASVSFDGTTDTKCLTQKGTWERFGTSNLELGNTATTALAGNTLYAGSATAGGSATSAEKLSNTTKIGDTNNPVYFTNGGVPTACDYELNKTVPSTALFTDENVEQTEFTGLESNSYELLMAGSTGSTTTIGGVNKSASITYTPDSDSLATGEGDVASGYHSHAEGYNTLASRKSQHVFGEYNVEDSGGADASVKGDYIEIVGNGTSGTRSNARTLDWNGNEWLSGNLTVNNAVPKLDVKSTEWTLTTDSDNDLSDLSYAGNVFLKGYDDTVVGRFSSWGDIDGTVSTQLQAYNKMTDGTSVYNALRLTVDKNGTSTYSVSSPENFRSALAMPLSIIDQDMTTDRNVSSGTAMQTFFSFTLQKGVWILSVRVGFSANTSGRRMIALSYDNATSMGAIYEDVRNPVEQVYTWCRVDTPIFIPDETKTVYIIGYQNSGSTLTTKVRTHALRVTSYQ